MSAAAITAARARLAAAFPGWTDATGDHAPTPRGRLPAFAVDLTRAGGERLAMGSAATLSDGVLTVALWVQPDGTDPETMTQTVGAQVRAALIAAPDDLGGAVWSLTPAGVDGRPAKNETALAVVEVTFDVQVFDGT